MTKSAIIQPPARFKLQVAAGNAQEFELWRWSVSPMFGMDAPDRVSRPAFGMEAVSYHFEDMAFAFSESSATIFDRSSSVIARSGIDHIIVQSYVQGGYTFDAEGRTLEIHPGDIAIIDLSRRAVLRTTSFNNLSVVIPRHYLVPLIANMDLLHGLVIRRGTPRNGLLMSYLQALYRHGGRFDKSDGTAIVQGTAALIAACVGASEQGRAPAESSVSNASLRFLRQVIDANLSNPQLGPDFLIEQFGFSRTTLYRLFAALGGVRNYIQQRRLRRAYQALSDPTSAELRISAIARQYGFRNDAVFSRAFRDAFGMSPSESRETAQIGYLEELRPQNETGGSFWSINRWMLGIGAWDLRTQYELQGEAST